MNIKEEIKKYAQELIDLRRDFHQHPELGFQEFRTSEVIEKYLLDCGIEVMKIATTGVVGLLKGSQEGATVILRADMDALLVSEENDLSYKSLYEGKMHACGHDGHVAMLLVAAKILAKHKEKIKGNIKFVFQPNEEEAGARIMIDEGVMENPKVDAALGIHLWTPLETGKIGISEGPIMGAHKNFKLRIIGKGGHTSAPQYSIDPILTAASIIQNVQMIQTREINALNPTVIMFGKINGGTAANIIPEAIDLEGTIRHLYEGNDTSEEKPYARFERIVKSICEAHQAHYELQFIPSNSVLINHPQLTSMVRQEAEKVVNDPQKDIVPYVCMAGEDFSEFSLEVPSTFIFVGTGNDKKGSNYPHHHARFNIDEDSLAIGVELHIRSVLAYLNKM
ncbi:M20 metallopeptidase family protein [Alkaliphilus peptidifermentans]|uniref:Amidohydrolase n=1 Tax=Alkaliphilus peptidifermentans DSM 18978 TaxID=1120976 RepID=A0A1G5JRG6_9FIRM|nr:amidohydrolase [Alkaliphilus peptidifermentans]SCY91032.1 amidohydrolase [Alkaliphilus peptidifermentans DSM 18978]